MKKVFIITSILLLPAAVSGCMFHGGESRYVSTTTLGQELSDLQRALEQGAIDDTEFAATKAELLAAKRWEKQEHHKHKHHHAAD